ncbi:MAG: DUF4173 domain-containing protein [Oscillospiraceae bacterium]|nr:DUF4173 domain-containing protein [Oscillospiraceae bacterium]
MDNANENVQNNAEQNTPSIPAGEQSPPPQSTSVETDKPAPAASSPNAVPQKSASPAAATPPRPKSPPVPLEKRDGVFFLLLFVFSIMAADFAFWNGLRAGLAITHTLFLILSTVYLAKKKSKPTAYSVFCGAASFAFGLVSATVANNMLIQFASCAAMCILAVMYFYTLWGSPKYPTGSYLTVLDVVRYTVAVPLTKLAEPFRHPFQKKDDKSSGASKVFAGLMIAIPLVCLVLPLLMSSDAAFEGLVSAFWEKIMGTAARFIVGTIIFFYLTSNLFAIRYDLDRPETTAKPDPLISMDSTIVNTILFVLSGVYVVYLFSQLGYFFNGFLSILPEGYTSAEYARRGFFELCVIAGINFVIIFVTLAFSRRREGKLSAVTKSLDIFVLVFTLLLIATSFSKIALYMRAYGLTPDRIIAASVLVVLIAAFACMAVKIFKAKFAYMKVMVTVASVVLLTLVFADVDRVSAKYNIWAYQTGVLESIDLGVFNYMLGSGATRELFRLLDDKDESVRNKAMAILTNKAKNHCSNWSEEDVTYANITIDNIRFDNQLDFRKFVLSDYLEQKLLEENLERYFDQYDRNLAQPNQMRWVEDLDYDSETNKWVDGGYYEGLMWNGNEWVLDGRRRYIDGYYYDGDENLLIEPYWEIGEWVDDEWIPDGTTEPHEYDYIYDYN